MSTKDRFLYLIDCVDTQNICDMIQDFLEEYQLKEFCEYIEDEFNIEYENNYIDLDDSDL